VTVGGVHASRTVPKGTKVMRIVFNPESQYQITQSTDGDNTVLSFPSKIQKVDIIQLDFGASSFYFYPTASSDTTVTFMDLIQVIDNEFPNEPIHCNVSYQIQDTTPTLITNVLGETGITTSTGRREFTVNVPVGQDNCPMLKIKVKGLINAGFSTKNLLYKILGQAFTSYVFRNNEFGSNNELGYAQITC
jgi:hypothetical protein